ncbi:helix-turn-helix domain-containing protein [Pigmentiphaga litoralis]|uniref:helix-turn-helix domain-containing protein n=1 Tax=Pigmentiphaga litoralis TaxID=516702 RepID=UPI00389ACC60
MTVKEVADYAQLNKCAVYRLAVSRRLPRFKVGANWRFKRGDIDGWIAAQSPSAQEAGDPLKDKKV